jgi:hypothetical protein
MLASAYLRKRKWMEFPFCSWLQYEAVPASFYVNFILIIICENFVIILFWNVWLMEMSSTKHNLRGKSLYDRIGNNAEI